MGDIIKTKLFVKGSSLTNAIFICIIVAVFSGCLVLVSHYHNLLNKQLQTRIGVINNNQSSFNYLLSNAKNVQYNKTEVLDVFEDGIPSLIEKKNWGFYDVLVCKTIFKNDTISKVALVGNGHRENNKLALFVTDYDKPLKLSGTTQIWGDLKIPNGKYGQAYVNGQKGNSIKFTGKQTKSQDKLPKIDKTLEFNISRFQHESINSYGEYGLYVNSFSQDTKVIDLDKTTFPQGVTCKGNYILYSKNQLELPASYKLHDVIVMAPKVKVMSGFKGNIQIVAEKEIDIDENVSLLYPSSIYVKNDIDSVLVTIQKGSKIAGGIVVDGNTQKASLHRKISIQEDATVIGDVYCYGSTELKGKIIGTLYTDKFHLVTNAAKYENVILNSTITKKELPEDFIGLPLFNTNSKEDSYEIIKAL